MAFNENLAALTKRLFNQISLLSRFAAVESIYIHKNRLILPLASLHVLAAIVHRESEFCDLSSVRKNACFWIAREPPDQHDLVEVCHGSSSVVLGYRTTTRSIQASTYDA